MVAFTVHEPPEPPMDRLDRADALVFVKEGWSLLAMLYAPLWFVMNRLLLAFAGYVAIVLVLWAANQWLGISGTVVGLGVVLLHLLIGLEADSLQRFTLDLEGWRDLGAVTGRNREDCERRFFDSWLLQQPVFAPRDPGEPSLGNKCT